MVELTEVNRSSIENAGAVNLYRSNNQPAIAIGEWPESCVVRDGGRTRKKNKNKQRETEEKRKGREEYGVKLHSSSLGKAHGGAKRSHQSRRQQGRLSFQSFSLFKRERSRWLQGFSQTIIY
ncbi:hypothetical protein SLA2020_377420 [Shorea laevis]